VKVLYTAEARVAGARAGGRGVTSDGTLDVRLRLPKEMGGQGDGTNPEQLFAVGFAACFETVLEMVGRRRRLDATDTVIDSRVSLLRRENGRTRLAVELDIRMPSIGDAAQAADLVREAHQLCPYADAVRGNVNVSLTVNGTPLPD
jgi:Ohr subfamily peroxiredoxin